MTRGITSGYSSVQKQAFKMPPISGKSKKSFMKTLEKYLTWNFIKNLFVNPNYIPFVGIHILIFEILINLFVIERVPYTEIDWKAYMQECEGFLNGTFDYSQLRGDTGPLVYPAGFVYIYSAFYFITNHGENIKLAQYIFLVVYLLQLCCVLRIYWKTNKVPPYVLVISILTSYRIHSIYVLRLFNDPIAILLLFVSLNLFLSNKWTLGSMFFSLAVSVKMNILLFAPPLLLFYLSNLTIYNTLFQLFICGIIQLFLGTPFLIGNPVAYLRGSFDLGRVFEHKWTVNYRFLDIELFESKFFHLLLLSLHILLLLVFYPMAKTYFNSYLKLKYLETQIQPQIDARNQENKIKRKINKMKPQKSSLKQRHQNVAEEKPEIEKKDEGEILTADQQKFLDSFESSLKKAGGKADGGKPATQQPKVTFEEPVYSINFNTTNNLFILPMFLANFIGIVCARSLHYQFYSWYFHTLPYLLWSTPFSNVLRFLILALIEFSWNTYPSTVFSSSLLHACHLLVLWGIYKYSRSKSS